MENKIKSLVKQNESIFNSLASRSIPDLGQLVVLTDDKSLEEQLELLNLDNTRLKELVKNNKPAPVIKEPVIKEPVPIKLSLVKPNDDNDDEDYTEPVAKFTTITNMEDIKRAFFNNDYQLFGELVREHNFKLYQCDYKYASEKDGAPDFAARNLIKGFVRNFDDYRKYFMICFRCYQQTATQVNTYQYPSLWIVNSNDQVSSIIGSLSEDFVFNDVPDPAAFYSLIQKMDPETENLMAESYVH